MKYLDPKDVVWTQEFILENADIIPIIKNEKLYKLDIFFKETDDHRYVWSAKYGNFLDIYHPMMSKESIAYLKYDIHPFVHRRLKAIGTNCGHDCAGAQSWE